MPPQIASVPNPEGLHEVLAAKGQPNPELEAAQENKRTHQRDTETPVTLDLSPFKSLQSLTLEQAFQIANENNPQLKAIRARIAVNEAQRVTAGARLNPMLLTDNGVAERTYRLGLEQVLELGGKRTKRKQVAAAQQAVTNAEIDTAMLNLRMDTRKAYTQLFNALEREQAYQEIWQATERLTEITKKREHAGDVAVLDVLQADIVSVNAQNDLQSASYHVISARNRLSALLNRPLDIHANLASPTSFAKPDLVAVPKMDSSAPLLQAKITKAAQNLEQLIQQALLHRPEIQENIKRMQMTQAQLALAKANRIPNLVLTTGADFVFGTGGGKSAFAVGNLELPIVNRQQGPIQEALAKMQLLKVERLALHNQIMYEVMNAHTAFVANEDRIQRYELEILPKAKRVLEMARMSFQEGKSPILMPLNAQQAYINTRLGYLQALMDYQNAISDLEKAVGTGL